MEAVFHGLHSSTSSFVEGWIFQNGSVYSDRHRRWIPIEEAIESWMNGAITRVETSNMGSADLGRIREACGDDKFIHVTATAADLGTVADGDNVSFNAENVSVFGNPASVKTTCGDITVHGNIGDVNTVSGDVHVEKSSHHVQSVSGDITIGENCIGGAASTSGDVWSGGGESGRSRHQSRSRPRSRSRSRSRPGQPRRGGVHHVSGNVGMMSTSRHAQPFSGCTVGVVNTGTAHVNGVNMS